MPIENLPAEVKALFADRASGDADRAAAATLRLFAMADAKVDWADEVWDELVAGLSAKDNHQRAFAAQLLARLAVSAPTRVLDDLAGIAALMRDGRAVTARLTVQSIWRIGLAGPKQARRTVDALALRYTACEGDKNADVVRIDVITSLGRLAAALDGELRAELDATVARLIGSESDPGVQFKQNAAWRKGQKLPTST